MSDAVRETLDRYYAALKAGDRAGLRGVVADEIEVHYPAPEGLLPWAGNWTGFEGFERFISTVGDHLVIDTVEPVSVHVAGDTVITVLRGEWTVQGDGTQGANGNRQHVHAARRQDHPLSGVHGHGRAGNRVGQSCCGVKVAQATQSREGAGKARKKVRPMARNDEANDIMAQTSFLYGGNAPYIEDMYARFQDDPASVPSEWQAFFTELKDDPEQVRKSAAGASLEAGQLAGAGKMANWSPRWMATGARSKR
jgi:ketosteroid isomerase-like protein